MKKTARPKLDELFPFRTYPITDKLPYLLTLTFHFGSFLSFIFARPSIE